MLRRPSHGFNVFTKSGFNETSPAPYRSSVQYPTTWPRDPVCTSEDFMKAIYKNVYFMYTYVYMEEWSTTTALWNLVEKKLNLICLKRGLNFDNKLCHCNWYC